MNKIMGRTNKRRAGLGKAPLHRRLSPWAPSLPRTNKGSPCLLRMYWAKGKKKTRQETQLSSVGNFPTVFLSLLVESPKLLEPAKKQTPHYWIKCVALCQCWGHKEELDTRSSQGEKADPLPRTQGLLWHLCCVLRGCQWWSQKKHREKSVQPGPDRGDGKDHFYIICKSGQTRGEAEEEGRRAFHWRTEPRGVWEGVGRRVSEKKKEPAWEIVCRTW